jgi:hypothetical protein
MTLSSNGLLLMPKLLEKLLLAWKSPPSLVEGVREKPSPSDWAPEVGFDNRSSNKAV